MGVDPGAFVVYAGTRPDKVAETETLMTNIVAGVAREGLTAVEIDRARNQLIAEQEMSVQDNGGLAMACALDELYGLGADRMFKTRARLEAVTADQIRQAAASILVFGRQAESIVRPPPGRMTCPRC